MMSEFIEILLIFLLGEVIVIGVIIIGDWWRNNRLGLFEPSVNCRVEWDTEFLYNECQYWKQVNQSLIDSLANCNTVKDTVEDGRGNIIGVYFDD